MRQIVGLISTLLFRTRFVTTATTRWWIRWPWPLAISSTTITTIRWGNRSRNWDTNWCGNHWTHSWHELWGWRSVESSCHRENSTRGGYWNWIHINPSNFHKSELLWCGKLSKSYISHLGWIGTLLILLLLYQTVVTTENSLATVNLWPVVADLAYL